MRTLNFGLTDSKVRFSWLHQTAFGWQTDLKSSNFKSLSLVGFSRSRGWGGIGDVGWLVDINIYWREEGLRLNRVKGQITMRPNKGPANPTGSSSANAICHRDLSLGPESQVFYRWPPRSLSGCCSGKDVNYVQVGWEGPWGSWLVEAVRGPHTLQLYIPVNP